MKICMKTFAVIGSKKSGKTITIEALVRGLTKKGYRVATLKHVSEENFSIDTEGKDSWRHAKAGAQTTIIVAPHEVDVIRRVETKMMNLHEIVEGCVNNVDYMILEGFRGLMENDSEVPKIVAIRAFEDAVEALNRFRPIIAFTGSCAMTAKELGKPVVNMLKDPEKLVKIVLSQT